MIRLIIFDLDGTLVNAYPAVTTSVNFTLNTLGFEPQTHAAIKRSVGWGDRHLMAQFVGEALADKAMRLYRPHHAKTLLKDGKVWFISGAEFLLKGLKKKKYLLAIASNRPTKFTRIILKKLGLGRTFDMVLCADRASRPKPHGDMLIAITKELKVDKSQTLYVGDMTIDVETGANAGIRTVAVASGSSTAEELKALHPFGFIDKIRELRSLL